MPEAVYGSRYYSWFSPLRILAGYDIEKILGDYRPFALDHHLPSLFQGFRPLS